MFDHKSKSFKGIIISIHIVSFIEYWKEFIKSPNDSIGKNGKLRMCFNKSTLYYLEKKSILSFTIADNREEKNGSVVQRRRFLFLISRKTQLWLRTWKTEKSSRRNSELELWFSGGVFQRPAFHGIISYCFSFTNHPPKCIQMGLIRTKRSA